MKPQMHADAHGSELTAKTGKARRQKGTNEEFNYFLALILCLHDFPVLVVNRP